MPMMMRAKYAKEGMMKYLSHLDLVRLFERAFRRAEIPLAFSQGFNPHPIVSFASPLSIGVSSEAEYFDLVLSKAMHEAEFVRKLNHTLPEGIRLVTAKYHEIEKVPSLMKESALISYRVEGYADHTLETNQLESSLDIFLDGEEIWIDKIIKKNKYKHRRQQKITRINIRPLIHALAIQSVRDNYMSAEIQIHNLDSGTVKPLIVFREWFHSANLQIDLDQLSIHRLEVFRINEQAEYEPILPSDSSMVQELNSGKRDVE